MAALLSRFLGDFVKGLEKENLRIGILSGDVTLENLELKKEALQNFDLPITIKSGTPFSAALGVSLPSLFCKSSVNRTSPTRILQGSLAGCTCPSRGRTWAPSPPSSAWSASISSPAPPKWAR